MFLISSHLVFFRSYHYSHNGPKFLSKLSIFLISSVTTWIALFPLHISVISNYVLYLDMAYSFMTQPLYVVSCCLRCIHSFPIRSSFYSCHIPIISHLLDQANLSTPTSPPQLILSCWLHLQFSNFQQVEWSKKTKQFPFRREESQRWV